MANISKVVVLAVLFVFNIMFDAACSDSRSTREPDPGGRDPLNFLSQPFGEQEAIDFIGRPFPTAQPVLIDSPQQDRTLVITVDANRDDPTRYLTLIFEVRDKATQAILHRQPTHASSRLAWSMRWLDNSVVQLQSSDVGTSCRQEQQDGTWSDAKCP